MEPALVVVLFNWLWGKVIYPPPSACIEVLSILIKDVSLSVRIHKLDSVTIWYV